MCKKTLLLSVLLVFFLSPIWAGGNRQQNETRTADDPAGFQDSIDIDSRKPGKWNYYLEAADKAGNIAIAGPENIYIDPASDLPRTTVINPTPNMRVQGNLNIVGIAVDDDGVDSVWFNVTRGRDGKGEKVVDDTQAAGKDYWSFFLDTTDQEIWTDGVYTITAWSIDINGLSGISDDFPAKVHRKHLVYWHLDRKKPDTVVTSHEIGALVSGNVKLRGTVADGNGINSLSYSVDGGTRYLPARFSQDRRTGDYTWEINIDTKKTFDDGAAVIWFKAQDGQGSIGNAAHLLFVNNTPPTINILYPPANATVNGIFSIAGYAHHEVGISSVTWNGGKGIGGEFEIIPGNHWWSADVDLRGQKLSSIDIEVRAVDVSGNVRVVKQKYKVDQNADLPVVTLSEPATGKLVDEGESLVVKGSISDDDGVRSVLYSLNNAEPVEIQCTGYFQFLVPGLQNGVNQLDVWAKDVTGVVGNKVQVKNITVPTALPEPRITNTTVGSGNTARNAAFYTGMTLKLEPKVRTVIDVAIKATTVSTASVTFGNLPPVAIRPTAGKDGYFRANGVAVPANLQSGYTKVLLKATDRFGREATFEESLFIENTNPGFEKDPYAAAEQWFEWIRPNLSNGRIVLSSEDDFLLGVAYEPLVEARIVASQGAQGATNLSVEVDEYGRLIMKAINQGVWGPFTLNLGHFTYSQQFTVIADFGGPDINITAAPQGWVRTSLDNVAFTVTSAHRVTAVEFSKDLGETWQNIQSGINAPVNSGITRSFDISDVEDGSLQFLIRATNESGSYKTADFTVLKDTALPQMSLIMPISDEIITGVNGKIRMGFEIKEAGAIKTITYNRPSSAGIQAITTEVFNIDTWDKDFPPLFLEVEMDSIVMPLAENMRFVFEDMAGNRDQLDAWEFVIDQQMDIPKVHVILPLDNEVITTDFIVSGIMFDDDGIKQITWRIDSTPDQIIEAANGFSIPIALNTLTDNDHTVTVVAEDIYGVKSEAVVQRFRVSLSEPEAAVTFPRFDTVLKEVIQITGTSADRNGIKEVQVSVDNGNTYNTAKGTTAWEYSFNSKILKDGAHVVFIRVYDNYEIPATYATMINVDNTPPDIALDSPGDGSISTGNVLVMGRTLDPNLDAVRVELRSLDGVTIRPDLRTRDIGNEEVIKESYELTGLRDGIYNIEVVGTDKAGNVTRVSRNVQLARETYKNFVDILYPLDNETVGGVFNLYGFAGGTDKPGTVTIRINGSDIQTNEVDDSGYYRFSFTPEEALMSPGNNQIMIYSDFSGTGTINSQTQNVIYAPDGPWVAIDTFSFGEFAFERPYLEGRAGYSLSLEDQEVLADKNADKELKDAIKAKVYDYTEISFDNGKTFLKTSKALKKGVDFRYRLETGEMIEGMHYILLRAKMKNGEVAMTRMIVQVDKTAPVIKVISPEAGGVYNQELAYSASATDDVDLVSLGYHLRIGDKNAYEIPGFLQGLYFEFIIPPFIKYAIGKDVPAFPFGGGATFMDVAFGLSFFDDNVKIQFQYGFMTQDIYNKMTGYDPSSGLSEEQVRYGGNVIGLKLLANVYTLPLGAVWGPDFDWLFASFGIGANFSYFDVSREGYTQSGEPTWLSALLLQIEFPKGTIPKQKYFRTFSLFTEGQLWFVPTDVNAEAMGIAVVLPKIIMGLRAYVF
jgi:hypothetical protein